MVQVASFVSYASRVPLSGDGSLENVNAYIQTGSTDTQTVESETLSEAVVMIASSRAFRYIKLIVEVGIMDEELFGIDSDDGT
jgi:hypothetical protein